MNSLSPIFVALAAFAVSCALSWWVERPGSLFYVIDHPNHRSLHKRPTPRSGGVAMVSTLILGGALLAGLGPLADAWLARLALGVALLAWVSYRDDRAGLPITLRIAAHAVAALLLLAPDLRADLPVAVAIAALLAVVWMINLFNFMDGSDGLAAAMALFGFAGLALIGYQAGNQTYALSGLLVVAAVAGFLPWNYPPARLFMGDTGSIVLGFLAGAMLYWGWRESLLSLSLGLLLFFPFLFDATLTLVVRGLKGEKVWQAHRQHLYQRLFSKGWTHARILAIYAILMALCLCLTMLVMRGVLGEATALSLVFGCGALAATWVYKRDVRTFNSKT